MNNKIYSIAEFRKCTREVFNLIDSDEDVYIKRFGKKYIIIPESYYLELLKPDEPQEPPQPGIKTPQEAEQATKNLVCKGTHYMSREDCGKIRCPWAMPLLEP